MPESADDVPTVLWVPSDRVWIDPPLVARTLYTQYTRLERTGAGVGSVAGLNVLRWAIGFAVQVGAGDNPGVAPWSDTTISVGWRVVEGTPQWFDLTRYGPMVTGEWYLSSGGPVVLQMIEIIRQA